jgi:hypothetical protein
VAKDQGSKDVKKIRQSLHHISVQNSVLHHEISGLKEVLKTQKKHKKKSKALEFKKTDKDWHGGAEFYSPKRVEKARADYKAKAEAEKTEKLKKAEMAELRRASKLYKEKIAQEKREAAVVAKAAREKEKAEKAQKTAECKAEQERQQQERNAAKALQLSQRGKRTASQAPQPKKRQKCVDTCDVGGADAAETLPAPPPKATRRGCNVKMPAKFK